MGFTFRHAGCVNRVEERRDESNTIKINGSPRRAAKTEEKPAGLKPADSNGSRIREYSER
jgi:hypothetical protein